MFSPKFVRRLPAVLLAAVSLAASGVFASSSSAAAPATPPNGIYTCDWIAHNPAAAAQAHVTCDPAVFFAAMAAPPTLAEIAAPQTSLQVCPYVPNGYRVGKGVFAWSDYYSTTYWQWRGLYSPANYTWYIQGYDGLNYVHGDNYDTSWHEQTGLMSYTYRWGAQNHSDTAQQWQTCVG